uniref:DapH/DapD/GlmU-related protein n=1 Tax=Roseihalotalea indica TaxID=2867963 RepID=A0AA49GR54_9BACT|nr:DapH/DapD/GlmU-related protein [Tunicatimonas sp. TK19036]
MIDLSQYIASFPSLLDSVKANLPWLITAHLKEVLISAMAELSPHHFIIENGIAIHQSAVIERNVMLKAPMIIQADCFIGANAYFREGVFLDKNVKIGPGAEIKSSIICSNTSIAHFNYIGNSIIGSHVNFEAGSIAANHYNERTDKTIDVLVDGQRIATGVHKFGSLVGDHAKIGANAVLSPGTILKMNSIVKRLELVEQLK